MSKRGRGRGAKSVSKELLKRSAAEAGLDSAHLKVMDDVTQPALYPDYQWKTTGGYWDESSKTTDSESKKDPAPNIVLCINRQRELLDRFQNRYNFDKKIVDVARYSDVPALNSDQTILAQFSATNRKLATDTSYIPSELLQDNVRVNSQGSYVANNLEEGSSSEREENEDLGGEDELGAEDYTTNYYASDNDTDDDEGEATF